MYAYRLNHIQKEKAYEENDDKFEFNDLIETKCSDTTEGILRGVFQNFNPLCGRNPIENGS